MFTGREGRGEFSLGTGLLGTASGVQNREQPNLSKAAAPAMGCRGPMHDTLGVKHTVNARERERLWELKNKRANISNNEQTIQKSQIEKEMFGSDLPVGDSNLALGSHPQPGGLS